MPIWELEADFLVEIVLELQMRFSQGSYFGVFSEAVASSQGCKQKCRAKSDTSMKLGSQGVIFSAETDKMQTQLKNAPSSIFRLGCQVPGTSTWGFFSWGLRLTFFSIPNCPYLPIFMLVSHIAAIFLEKSFWGLEPSTPV